MFLKPSLERGLSLWAGLLIWEQGGCLQFILEQADVFMLGQHEFRSSGFRSLLLPIAESQASRRSSHCIQGISNI